MMNRKLLSLSILFILIMVPGIICAATYWIDDNGTQTSLSNCKGSTPLSGSSACSPTVNYNAVSAGDTVYFRAGTYSHSTAGINPTNSGSSGNRITFAAYSGENVIFTDSSGLAMCIKLENGQDYITVRGIKCQNFYHHVHIQGTSGNYANYNEIDSCIFSGMYDDSDIDWRGSTIEEHATYNWIHNCTFEKYGSFYGNNDNSVVFEIGWDMGLTDASYNVIENNILQSGGHHVLGLQGYRNVVRNNYLQNNRWSLFDENYYGCKVIYSLSNLPEGFHLIENNRISFGDQSSEHQSEGEGILLSSRGCIIRHNVWDNNNECAIFIHRHGEGASADENHIYNNTFWYNGHNLFIPAEQIYSHAITIVTGDAWGGTTQYTDNVFKNNLFWDNANLGDKTKSIRCDIIAKPYYPNHCEYANNYEGGTSGNPQFVSISGTPDPSNRNQFNFNLKSSSPAIDGGAHLTQANGSGSSSTTLKVDDAKYFQDGWANGAGGGAVVHADWIAIGTVSNVVQIKSINYATNTITLVSPKTWGDNDKIWLYKKSDGVQVLFGSAPDYGAYEYGNPSIPSPPKKLRIIP